MAATGSMSPATGRSPWALAMRRFRRNRRSMISVVLLLLVGGATLLVPEVVSSHGIRKQVLERKYEGPSSEFWFGTDALGRDMVARTFYGGRISFAVGFLATAMAIFIGVTYGSISAFVGGKVDMLMMRIVDVLYGLPYMFLVIILLTMIHDFKVGIDPFYVLFIFIGCLSWMTMARIARGQVLSLREREFVEAARALGTPTLMVIARHIIPNIVGPVIVYTTLTIPTVMLSEAFLSFLGLGISEPQTSWGVLLGEGADVLLGKYWWMLVFPGAMLATTLYCLNSIGDGLRDAFDIQSERAA